MYDDAMLTDPDEPEAEMPVPDHLVGTRAALFYLLQGKPAAKPSLPKRLPDAPVAKRHATFQHASAARGSDLGSVLLQDNFIFFSAAERRA